MVVEPREDLDEMVRKYHPAPQHLSRGAFALMRRNSCQVLGEDLSKPSKAIVCWTHPDKGGTTQALRIAKAHGILIFNMFLPELATHEQVWTELQKLPNFKRTDKPNGSGEASKFGQALCEIQKLEYKLAEWRRTGRDPDLEMEYIRFRPVSHPLLTEIRSILEATGTYPFPPLQSEAPNESCHNDRATLEAGNEGSESKQGHPVKHPDRD